MAKEKSGAAAANGNGHHGVAEAPAGKEDVPEVQDRKAEQLKALNTMLVKEATQRQGEVAALTARLEELSADDAALAATESAVALSAVAAPLRAGADEIAALRARLAAVQESLHAADLRMAVETGARGEADARLEAAAEEIATVLKLLREKEVEVASVSEKVSSMAAMVAEMEGKNAELFGEKSELGKQLEEAKVAAVVLSREKAEVEGRAQEFRKSPEAYNLHLHEKLTAKVNELNVLGAKKAEMDARVEYLVAELSAAVAKKGELEAEVVANKREVDSVRGENDMLRSEIVAAEKQHSLSVAEVESLRVELNALEKAKEAAAMAFGAEKAQLVEELAILKKKVEKIQAEKEAAEGATREKDAQIGELRAEFEKLNDSMSRLKGSCDNFEMGCSHLLDERRSILKYLGNEKKEAAKLRSTIEEMENCNGKKDSDIGQLKADLEEKKGKIDTLNKDVELLQLAVAEALKRKKGDVWTWLYAATTTMVAAISFIYATRSR